MVDVLMKQQSSWCEHTPGMKAYAILHLQKPLFLAELVYGSLFGEMGLVATKKGLLCMQSE